MVRYFSLNFCSDPTKTVMSVTQSTGFATLLCEERKEACSIANYFNRKFFGLKKFLDFCGWKYRGRGAGG